MTVLPGCTTTHLVRVDATRRAQADQFNGTSFWIEPANRNIDATSLDYQYAVAVVMTALSTHGLYEAIDAKTASMIVAVAYGVSEPEMISETRTEPIYRVVETPPQTVRVPAGTGPGGQQLYETVEMPGMREKVYIGEQVYEVNSISYEKFLQLTARINRPGDKTPALLWSVSASIESDKASLRDVLPVLAAATMDFVGDDTNGQQTIRISDKDDAVVFVKQSL